MKQILICGSLFDSVDGTVKENQAVVIEDNKIAQIVPKDQAPKDGEVIDLSDKFVMPGLIDAHMHMNLSGQADFQNFFIQNTAAAITVQSIVNLQKDLLAGFTTIRDEGAYEFTDVAVRNAIAKGMIAGPRAMVSGSAITATGGHADSHFTPAITGPTQLGIVANSPDEMRKVARFNFKHGADQLKIMATGGVSSMGDDPNASEFTLEEMKAAIDIATGRGRITSAHAHGREGIKTAIRAGITSIEHGMLMDEECADMMAEHGTYLIPTIIAANNIVVSGVEAGMPEWAVEKAAIVLANHKNNLKMCREKV